MNSHKVEMLSVKPVRGLLSAPLDLSIMKTDCYIFKELEAAVFCHLAAYKEQVK